MSSNTGNKALKAGAWYTVSNFLMRSIGILTTPIFARLLTKGEFGNYNNFTAVLSVLTIVITLNLDSTFISARYEYEKSFDEYILSVLTLSTLSSMIAILALNLLFPILESVMLINRFYMNCILVYIVFLPAVNMFQAREQYYYRYKMSVFLGCLVTLGTAILSVILVTTMDDHLTGRIIGSLIPTILVGLVLYFVILKYGKHITTKYWKYAIKICLPYIPHLLSMSLLNSMDKNMILRICGEDDNAVYSLAYTCGALVTILIVSLNSAFAPWLGKKLHEKKYKDIREFSVKYILIFVAMAFMLIIFAPEVLYIMGGQPYLVALYVMPPVACGCIFQFLYTMFVNVEQFSKKTIGMAFASASAAVINYVLNAIFIPRYGYIAAAYTTLVGFAWLLLSHMLLVFIYKLHEVYPYKIVFAVAGGSLVLTLGINYLYDVPVLRYVLGGLYTIALICGIIKNKDVFIQLVKGKKNV